MENLNSSFIKTCLDRVIVGNEQAKRQMAGILVKYINREKMSVFYDNRKPLTVVVEGPSGSGKTTIVEEAAKILGRTFVYVDASAVVSDAYSGGYNLGDYFYSACAGRIRELRNCVVFIDEFDKILSDPKYAFNTQTAFLKLLDGGEINIRDRKENRSSLCHISCKDMLIFIGGTFSVSLKEDYTNSKKESAGFMKEKEKDDEIFDVDIRERMKKIGFIDEIIGRISESVTMKKLDIKKSHDLINKNNGVFDMYQKMLKKCYLTECRISDKCLNQIALSLRSSKYGARDLNYILEPVFSNIIYKLSLESVIERTVYLDVNKAGEIIYTIKNTKERERK